MPFPISAQNNQLYTLNGIVYVYNSTKNTWTKVAPTSANVITTDTANVVSNISSTSTTTGALRVAGGAGIAGNVFVGAVYTNSYFYANGTPFTTTGGNGFTGSAGAAGSNGFTGSAGSTGFVGSAGSVGFTGSAGTGFTGSAGAGFTGSAGTVGFTGSIGFTGSLGLFDWTKITGNHTAVNRQRLMLDSTSGVFTVTLPATPTTGTYIQFTDAANLATNPVTISRNGSTVEGVANDLILDVPNTTYEFIYDGATWQVTSTTGPRGQTGFTGSAGTAGTAGFTGSAGAGFTGSIGSTGFTGSGGTGFTGSAGSNGFTGSAGFIGSAGAGFTGSAGVGFTGSAGQLSAWIRRTANYTAVSGDRIIADTTGGTFTVTLPATPGLGNSVIITDGGNFSSNSLFVGRNGSTIESVADDVEIDIGAVNLEFIYDGSTWQIVSTFGPTGYTGSRGGPGIATSSLAADLFTGNGVQTTFTLSVTPTGINQTMVNIDGVSQIRDSYSVSGNTITFTEAPAAGARIEVTVFVYGTANFVNRIYTGNGTTTAYTVTAGVTAESILVTNNGIVQRPTTDYTVSGSTLTFVTAPANNSSVQIREIPAGTNGFTGSAGTGGGGGSTAASVGYSLVFGL